MNRKKLKCACIVGVVLLVISLALTVMNYINVNSAKLDYEKVRVYVVSAEAKHIEGIGKYPQYKDEVVVKYENKEYTLDNVYSGEMAKYKAACNTYSPVEVYLSDGKMYSNIAGVRTSTGSADSYFALLAISGVLFLADAIMISLYYDYKKKGKFE